MLTSFLCGVSGRGGPPLVDTAPTLLDGPVGGALLQGCLVSGGLLVLLLQSRLVLLECLLHGREKVHLLVFLIGDDL